METPKCIHCSSEYTYELSDTSFGCSECGNEFTLEEIEAAGKFIVLDSLGNELETGDDLVIVQKGKMNILLIQKFRALEQLL